MKWYDENGEFPMAYLNTWEYDKWARKRDDFHKEHAILTYSYRYDYWVRCTPLKDKLRQIDQNYVTSIPKDATLLFDKSSQYPRYKLGLTEHKRCIKPEKADYIVVGEDNSHRILNVYIYKCGDRMLMVESTTIFAKKPGILRDYIMDILDIEPHIVYAGQVLITGKHSEFMYQYMVGNYTHKFITDNDLDNVINNILVDPQFEELLAIANQLNSPDAETRKLALKMLVPYNSTKYKLSLRLVLHFSNHDMTQDIGDVATQQLIKTLNLTKYSFTPWLNVQTKLAYSYHAGEQYTVEDIAIAKELVKELLKAEVNKTVTELRKKYGELIPDVEVICN